MQNNQTKLLYLENMYLTSSQAKVLDIQPWENSKTVIILDATIFYPQGGGQPYDKGQIVFPDGAVFDVSEVWKKDGIVYHVGEFKNGAGLRDAQKDFQVELYIDQDLRNLHNRLHTAGHLIDYALANLGLNLEPTKGYHFPHGAYVEYKGILDDVTKEKLNQELEVAVNEIVKANLAVNISCEYSDTQVVPMRYMRLEGYPAIPCGGTHVARTGEVEHVTIRKIKNEKGNTRISYAV